jgi:hypothetical protein
MAFHGCFDETLFYQISHVIVVRMDFTEQPTSGV